MDTLADDRRIIETILADYASIPFSYGQIDQQLVFDRERDHYLLMMVGQLNDERQYGALIHVDLIDGKFWIQYDGTERGVATDLLDAGIPKDRIVLGFKSPEIRKHTGFAVA